MTSEAHKGDGMLSRVEPERGGLGGPANRGNAFQHAVRKVRARDGKEVRARPYNKQRCPHNRDHYSCRECGGAGICVHKRRKSQVAFVILASARACIVVCVAISSALRRPDGYNLVQCRECGGKSVCQHNRVRSYCKDCGGGGLCHHNRVRSKCKECGGSGICKHGRHKVILEYCKLRPHALLSREGMWGYKDSWELTIPSTA